MHSAKSDTNNDVKLVRDRLIINGKTYTHIDIIEAPGDKGSNREPPKGDRSRKTANAVNTELSLSRAPSPHSQKDSGAIPKINFVSQNIYTLLRNLRDLGDDTFSWGGKKKATSPLEQTSSKKAREATPLNARINDGSSGDVTVTPGDVSEKETASGTPHFPDKSADNICKQQVPLSDPLNHSGLSSGEINNGSVDHSVTMEHT